VGKHMVRHLGFSPSQLSHQANAQQKLPSPFIFS
jgi:hypothetical protein